MFVQSNPVLGIRIDSVRAKPIVGIRTDFSKAKPIFRIPNQFCVTGADFSTPINILGESSDLHMNVGIRCFILLCGAETGAVCENSPIFI